MSLCKVDLPERPKAGVMLYCGQCGGEFSATRGDYFAAEPDAELVHCGYDMALVQRRVSLQEITPEEAEEDHGTTN